MQCQKEPEEGIDDFRTPSPLSLPSLSVCLLPSFIPSMVDPSTWQAGRPAVLTLVPVTREETLPEGCADFGRVHHHQFPFSSEGLTAQGLQLCVSVRVWFWSKLPGSSQNSQARTHTHPRSNSAEKLLDLQMLEWQGRKA